jgi:hypothetical protein
MYPLNLLIAALFALLASTVSAQETLEPAMPASRPMPDTVITEGRATLALYFETIAQGQVGLAHIYGSNITDVRAAFSGNTYAFFSFPEDGYYGLLVAGMAQRVGNYDLTVVVRFAGESIETIVAPIEVIPGAFIRQEITVSEELGYLVDSEVERHELAQLKSLFEAFRPEQLWDESGFLWPLEAELTSPFGAFRVFNETTGSRHTGWDMRAQTGAPIAATAAGRVAFAGVLNLRGNYILIDHGYGIYSGYAHLSVVHVTRGQTISAGQIIGQVGSSGRSGGAHFHWEMVVNGEWVDSVQFLEIGKSLFNPPAPATEIP